MSTMSRSWFVTVLAFGCAVVSGFPAAIGRFTPAWAAENAPLANSRQVVAVVTDSWDAIEGTLAYFDRAELGAPWHKVRGPLKTAVGRTGLAWGLGLHGQALGAGPVKKEGDGKAPAGVFRLSAVFGYGSAADAGFLKMPYVPLGADTECVDDPASSYYNLIVERTGVESVDWHSSEKMRRPDVLYKWGVVVDHNPMPRAASGGSCIFLHIWRGPASPTVGCTAMDESDMNQLLHWLNSASNPVLVQLPRAEYERFRTVWKLPETFWN